MFVFFSFFIQERHLKINRWMDTYIEAKQTQTQLENTEYVSGHWPSRIKG